MSNLEIIGAGFGRTGTKSLRDALNYLGYRTHHMQDVIEDPSQDPEIFENAFKNPEEPVDWDRAYAGYNAAVDWPTSAFCDRLLPLYPNAKVILTVRDPESWFKSVCNTISKWPGVDETYPERLVKAKRMASVVSIEGHLHKKDVAENKDFIVKKFLEHNEHIKNTVRPENLLVMNLNDGWENLCKFLGKPVPKIPYPHSNKGENFHQLLNQLKEHLIEASA